MNAGNNYKRALAWAKANANRDGRPRWLHNRGGVWWIDKTPIEGAEQVEPDFEHDKTMPELPKIENPCGKLLSDPSLRRDLARKNPDEPEDLDRAVVKFLDFHKLDPNEIGQLDPKLEIPTHCHLGGESQNIVYRSDKWEGINHDYIHDHDVGTMTYFPKRGGEVSVPDWIREAKTLVLLGKCLAFQYMSDEGVMEAKTSRPYPELYCTPDGRCLLVISNKKEIEAMIWGPKLRVEPRGIVG